MIDAEEMKEFAPQGNKVVSLKLSSSENIVAQYVDLLEDDGILVLKFPLKIMQGIDQDGNERIMFQRYDPASVDEVFAFSVSHVISIQPASYMFKQQYVSNVLRYKLYDIEFSDENSVFDYLTTYLMKICEDVGVEAKMEMLPISLKNKVRH